MTATWTVIGVPGAFAAAVLVMVFQIFGKVDGLRTELKGDISGVDGKIGGLRTELKEDIARVETTLTRDIARVEGSLTKDIARVEIAVASIDTKLGRTNERIDALYRHLAIPEGHPA